MEYKNKYINSCEIANKFSKRHDSVLRDIDNILKSNNELSNDFILSNYKNSRGKFYRCYELSKNAYKILTTKYSYSAMNPRFEFKFENLLREMFPSEKIFTQYQVLNYRIDFFMPDIQIIIEYDEDQHKYSKDKDIQRMKEIKAELNKMLVNGEPFYDGDSTEPNPWLDGIDSFSVIRIEKDKEIDGIRKLCIEITEHTMRPCSDFMKIA